MQSATQQGSQLQSLRVAQKYVKVGVIVYFVIVPVVSSVVISHAWAVNNADVYFFLPYISDSGGDPPQSAIFGLGLTTASIAAIITFALRYITVMDISKARNRSQYIYMLNYLNFLAGIGIFFGLLIVAMNPTGHLRRDGTWLSPIFYPHVLGASVLFVSGLSYMLVNSLLTLCLVDQYHNHAVFKTRAAIFFFDLLSCAVTAAKYPEDFLSMKPHPSSPREYPEGTMISIIAEWFMLAAFMGYFYTMKSELDAMVVVIGIQKRRSTLAAEDSEVISQPPPLPSENVPGKRIILQQPSAIHSQPHPTNGAVAVKGGTESLSPLANAPDPQPVFTTGSSRLLPELSTQKARDHGGGAGPSSVPASAKSSGLDPDLTLGTTTERKTAIKHSSSLATASTTTSGGTTAGLSRSKPGSLKLPDVPSPAVSSGCLRRGGSPSGASTPLKRGSPGRYVRPKSWTAEELAHSKVVGGKPSRALCRTMSGRSTSQGRSISPSHSRDIAQ
ncbi:uncharacterized protein LOC144130356 [Amblyomma americanum]